MQILLRLAHLIDAISDRFAVIAKWAMLLACFISAGNAVMRYVFDYSSNAFLEIQWYLFAVCVMFGAAQVLRVNEHVRVDVLYTLYPSKGKVLIDLAGLLFFLLPFTIHLLYMSWPLVVTQYVTGEMSNNAGGLIRWPVTATIPIGLALLALQGVAEVIKRVGWLMRVHEMDTHYERPLQ